MMIMIHAAGKGHGRENSVEALLQTLPYNPDLIEVDVRKSRDGILFCYHGFPSFPFFFLAYFLRWFSFSIIQKIIRVNTLEEILACVQTSATFFLDMKISLNPKLLNDVCQKFPRHSFLIASRSLTWLENCKKSLPENHSNYKYILNRAFFFFKRGVHRAHGIGLYACKLLPTQCTAQNISLMKKQGIQHMIENKKLAKQFGSLWVCVDVMQN